MYFIFSDQNLRVCAFLISAPSCTPLPPSVATFAWRRTQIIELFRFILKSLPPSWVQNVLSASFWKALNLCSSLTVSSYYLFLWTLINSAINNSKLSNDMTTVNWLERKWKWLWQNSGSISEYVWKDWRKWETFQFVTWPRLQPAPQVAWTPELTCAAFWVEKQVSLSYKTTDTFTILQLNSSLNITVGYSMILWTEWY